jgi:hypothetical protein
MKGPISDFIDEVFKLEDLVFYFCTSMEGLFAHVKPSLHSPVDCK